MKRIETDYLIVGAGAVGLCFADTMLERDPDARMTIVDRHPKPGGHWNDAYGFVSLHQPSSTYGLSSMELGTGRIDESGPNEGFMELASGAEVLAHFDNAMRDRLLPSGRVTYHPSSEYCGEHRFRGLLSDEETEVDVHRRVVDCTYFQTATPATHTRQFKVADDVRIDTPGSLVHLWRNPERVPRHYCILGGGKTAMDTGVFLLSQGVAPDRITWVRPRESWLINRAMTQPGASFFADVVDGQRRIFEAAGKAATAEELFLDLEATGDMLRLDPDVMPRMFHYATISEGEVAMLRRIGDVVRQGRVHSIDGQGMVLAEGERTMPDDTLYIDCTASAVRPRPTVPVFQEGLITPQLMFVPLVGLNASITAIVEARDATDEEKNALCTPSPFVDDLSGYPMTLLGTAMNRFAWSQDAEISAWTAKSRLMPGSRAMAQVQKDNPAALAGISRVQKAVMEAIPNLRRLAEAGEASGA